MDGLKRERRLRRKQIISTDEESSCVERGMG